MTYLRLWHNLARSDSKFYLIQLLQPDSEVHINAPNVGFGDTFTFTDMRRRLTNFCCNQGILSCPDRSLAIIQRELKSGQPYALLIAWVFSPSTTRQAYAVSCWQLARVSCDELFHIKSAVVAELRWFKLSWISGHYDRSRLSAIYN